MDFQGESDVEHVNSLGIISPVKVVRSKHDINGHIFGIRSLHVLSDQDCNSVRTWWAPSNANHSTAILVDALPLKATCNRVTMPSGRKRECSKGMRMRTCFSEDC